MNLNTEEHKIAHAPLPCQCGKVPAYRETQNGAIHILRLWCACGQPCGATLMYDKPRDRERMMQAGIDGWNMSRACT